jgi:hypothetical protein
MLPITQYEGAVQRIQAGRAFFVLLRNQVALSSLQPTQPTNPASDFVLARHAGTKPINNNDKFKRPDL